MNTSKRLRSISVAINFLLPVCLASLIFCLSLASAARASELKAELVKRTWEGAPASFLTGQVQLTFPDGRTKLLKYRSHLRPVVAEGKVYIFTTKDAKVNGIVVYDSPKGRGQSFPLPVDLKLNSYFGQPSFSPDGTMVAYYFVSHLEKQPQPEKKQYERQEYFINRTGKTVAVPTPRAQTKWRPIPGDFSEGLAHSYNEKKVGFRDLAGKIVIPPQFDEAGDFSDGLAPVRIGGKWGYIDKTGKYVVPPQFYLARNFSEGLASVNIGGKWGYGKWGFTDKTGKMAIPAQYDDAGSFSEGLAWVAVDGKYGFIDQEGKIVIQPQYDNVEDFHQGVALVRTEGEGGGGVRVRSWPDWRLLWQSPLCLLRATDVPPMAPIWETKSRVEFDPLFFDPPRFLSFQVPEGEKKGQ
jgi:hypothetical protein